MCHVPKAVEIHSAAAFKSYSRALVPLGEQLALQLRTVAYLKRIQVLWGNFGSIRFHGQPLFSFKSTNIAFSLDVNGVRLLQDGGADCAFLTWVLTLGGFAGPAKMSLSELGGMAYSGHAHKALEAALS
jgi:hypothetical protein